MSFVDVPEKAYVEGTLGVYELKRVDLLRDVFVWAYERSSQRYRAIQETAAEPDPVRLRYRNMLSTIVGAIVREQKHPKEAEVRKVATPLVPAKDLNRVVEMAIEDLTHLHDGNVSRYQLRLSEYRAWRSLQKKQAK